MMNSVITLKLAVLALACETLAQTYYWNPSPAGGGEAQKTMNWTSGANGGGTRPPTARDDGFEAINTETWKWIDSVPAAQGVSTRSADGKLRISAAGEDVWQTVNQFAALYRTDIQGGFDVTVKVESQSGTNPWSKAGLMISNDFTRMTAGGFFTVEITRENGYVVHTDSANPQGRLDYPQNSNHAQHPTAPNSWLRCTKRRTATGGWVFTGYYRKNLSDPWTQIPNPLNGALESYTSKGTAENSQVGLFVCSHITGVQSLVVFDDFEGGGDLGNSAYDLSFGGAGPLAGTNAILGANVGAKSVDFTGYAGDFSFGGWNLTLTGNATFVPTMRIHPNTGRLTFAGPSGTQTLVPKVNDTLPSVWKAEAGELMVLSNPLLADGLHIQAGTVDLNGNSARLQQFTSAGGTLEGLTDVSDTLLVSGSADFSGLTGFTPGAGTVAIKAVGAGKVVDFVHGNKLFGNLTLWTVPAGAGTALIRVGGGHLQVGGDLIFRGLHAPATHNGDVSFVANAPDVTVTGNIGQIIEGTAGANWHPIRMGSGTWRAHGNVAFTLRGGSADNGVLELARASGLQTVAVGTGEDLERLAAVRHTGAGTARLTTTLMARDLALTAGTLDFNGQDVDLAGNLSVTGGSAILANLGGSDIVAGGDAAFLGEAGSRIPLNPAADWTIKVAGAFTADHVDVARSNASGGATARAGANSADQGRNINWSFNNGPITQVPVITAEPKDTSAVAGTNAYFRTSASGQAPKAWAWRRVGDTTMLGTDSVLTVAATAAKQGFLYRCIVTNPSGADTTRDARLTVLIPATVSVEPQDAVAEVGKSATFTVIAAGPGTITYAWRRKGADAVISNSSVLTLNNLTLAQDDTYYQCIVTNVNGSDTTREAKLDVTPTPVPAKISLEPRDTTVYVTQKAAFSVAATGTDPIAYQWRRNGDTAVLSTEPVYTIDSAALAQDGQVFRCYVSNAYGKDTSLPVTLRVLPPPLAPAIVREPSDTLVKVGARAAFSAGVLGSKPLAYEWRRKGDTTVISRDSLFAIAAATAGQSGNSYYLVVSNAAGADTSAEARLTVRTCDSLKVETDGDTTVGEGVMVALFGSAVCADHYAWSVLSGPAPLLLDPGVDTLAFRTPRVSGDTAIRYRFTAHFGATLKHGDVTVRIKETIPDPAFELPPAALAWNGSSPLAVKANVFNRAQLALHTGYPVRYEWSLDPQGADTAQYPDSLVLKDPTADGALLVALCMDNGGKASCDTATVDVQRVPSGLGRAGLKLPGGLTLAGARLTLGVGGTVRIWSLRGSLLFEAQGPAGAAFTLPAQAFLALRGARARLVFTTR